MDILKQNCDSQDNCFEPKKDLFLSSTNGFIS